MQKIVIRAPKELGKQAATLALVQYFSQKMPELSIEVIVDQGAPQLYQYVELVKKIHELPQEKDGVLTIFPWVHNNKDFFAIDLYMDLRGTNASATLGIALKAKARVGFANAFTKPMFTASLPVEKNHQFLDERYLALCESYFNQSIPGQLNGEFPLPNEKEETQLLGLGSFLLLGLKSSLWPCHQKIWQRWFRELSGGTLVIVLDQDDEETAAKEWLNQQKSDNFLVMQKPDARATLMLMSYAKGVLSDSPVYTHVANFYGQTVGALAFELSEYPTFSTFSPRPHIFLERDGQIATWISADGERLIVDQEEATDALFSIFNL